MPALTRSGRATITPGSGMPPVLASLPIVEWDFANAQALAFTGTSGQSAAIDSDVVRICATEDCYYCCGADPTAIASSPCTAALLPAGVCELLAFTRGWKIAVIAVSSVGTMNIVPAENA